MGGPNDISRGKDGNFYIAEQEDDGNPAYCRVRERQGKGARPHGKPPCPRHRRRLRSGDIYAGLTQDRSVDKFVRAR